MNVPFRQPITAFSTDLTQALGGGWPRRAIGALVVPSVGAAARAAGESLTQALIDGRGVALVETPGPGAGAFKDSGFLARVQSSCLSLAFSFEAPATARQTLEAIWERAREHGLLIVLGFEQLVDTPPAEQRALLRRLEKVDAATLFVMVPGAAEAPRKITRLVRTMSLHSFELDEDLGVRNGKR